MAHSTGKNFDQTVLFLLESTDAQLVSKVPSQYKRKDLPDNISEKLQRCDIPYVEKNNGNIFIYFSCCSDDDIILGLEVISRFPDIIEKQVYDLLLPNKSVAGLNKKRTRIYEFFCFFIFLYIIFSHFYGRSRKWNC